MSLSQVDLQQHAFLLFYYKTTNHRVSDGEERLPLQRSRR